MRSTYLRDGRPGLVLRPGSTAEVSEALLFAREQDVPLAVRSGGHGISGRSTNDGGIVIDLAKLNRVELLDPGTRRVRVGPGARWGEVGAALMPHRLAISSGDFGEVGAGGLATAGGIGLFGRAAGLTIDRLRAADLVLADGTAVHVDADDEPDLFWAVRGAGGNFGIATGFELEAHPLGDVVHSRMVFASEDLPALLEHWGQLIEQAPRELTSFLTAARRPGSPPVVQVQSLYAGESVEAATAALRPLLEIGPLVDQQAQLAPYAAFLPARGAPQHGAPGEPLFSNGFAVHLTRELGEMLGESLGGPSFVLSIRALGGAIKDVDAGATAFAHRHQSFNIATVSATTQAEFHRHWDELRPHLDGLYLSFETDPRPERLAEAFPGSTLDRLRRLKSRYDPDGVFDQNFPIPPAPLVNAE